MTLLVFFATFGLYLLSVPPSLAPWRDTGELCVVVSTLSVAHPPSYPLYTILGRIAAWLPTGQLAYRLNVFSAVAGAAACAILFRALKGRHGVITALTVAMILALGGTFWSVCQVSEMYSLWVLGVVVLFILAENIGDDESVYLWPGFCFLSGLALSNRLDTLLIASGLLWIAHWRKDNTRTQTSLWLLFSLIVVPAAMILAGSNMPMLGLIVLTAALCLRGQGSQGRWGQTLLWIGAGVTVYLFLPIRSSTGPFLDWNHPARIDNFIESLTRSRYGGTLDLVSRNYAMGEMCGENLRMWGRHLWSTFGPMLIFALIGAIWEYKSSRQKFLGRFVAWWWAGPMFLFLANMPPNPHAAAIVEPHYLMSDIAVLFWLGQGLSSVNAQTQWKSALAIIAAMAWPFAQGTFSRQYRRADFYGPDYAANVFRSAPINSIVVAKKDVQLYSLWYRQTIMGYRPDINLIAQGLSGAYWYQEDLRRRGSALSLQSLDRAGGWNALANQSGAGAILLTHDVEPPIEITRLIHPSGVLLALSPQSGRETPNEVMVRRGHRRVSEAPDFFTSDLIDNFALSSFRHALELSKKGLLKEAEAQFLDAWNSTWLFPDVALNLGYLYASRGHLTQALPIYELAVNLFIEKNDVAHRYRALPPVLESLKQQTAEAYLHLGVITEKLGQPEQARERYLKSLAIYPLAQAHYNIAASLWNMDFPSVEQHLGEALKLDPGHVQARQYLDILNRRSRAKK